MCCISMVMTFLGDGGQLVIKCLQRFLGWEREVRGEIMKIRLEKPALGVKVPLSPARVLQRPLPCPPGLQSCPLACESTYRYLSPEPEFVSMASEAPPSSAWLPTSWVSLSLTPDSLPPQALCPACPQPDLPTPASLLSFQTQCNTSSFPEHLIQRLQRPRGLVETQMVAAPPQGF